MNLRVKTPLIIGVVLLATFLLLLMYSRFFLLNSYRDLETESMDKNIVRATMVLNNYLDQLARTNSDYAGWDDSYAFIRDHNQKYIKTNLIDLTFANAKISLMVYMDASGRTVFAKHYDLDKDQIAPLPPTLLAAGSPVASFYQTPMEKRQGLLALPDGMLLLTCRPILTSNNAGPARGVLIFGRFIDQEIIELLDRSVGLPASVHALNDQRLPGDCRAAWQKMSAAKTVKLVNPLDDKQVAAYGLLMDLTGQPAAIVKLTNRRQVYAQGCRTIAFYQIILFAIGLLTMGGLSWLLERLIITRLYNINLDISRLGNSGDLTARLPVEEKKDELTAVRIEINKMLASLQAALNAERLSELKFRQLFDASSEALFLVTLDGRIVDCNSAAVQLSGTARQELQKMTAADLVSPETAAGFPVLLEQLSVLGGFKSEITAKRKNGEDLIIAVTGKAIDFKGEKLALVVVHDITGQKRTAEEMKSKLEQLEDFSHVAVDRELKMLELEKENNALLQELGREPKY